jgi:hypothetical protein
LSSTCQAIAMYGSNRSPRGPHNVRSKPQLTQVKTQEFFLGGASVQYVSGHHNVRLKPVPTWSPQCTAQTTTDPSQDTRVLSWRRNCPVRVRPSQCTAQTGPHVVPTMYGSNRSPHSAGWLPASFSLHLHATRGSHCPRAQIHRRRRIYSTSTKCKASI